MPGHRKFTEYPRCRYLSELELDRTGYAIRTVQAWGVHESGGESYSNYADIIGALECAKLELYRRGVGPYEDIAIAKNGDL